MQPMNMMLFLKKKRRLLSLTYFPSLLPFSSSLTSAVAPKSQFVKDYLINSCGFSPKKAATASKYVSFTSPSTPDSVRHFLKHHAGFTDANIRSIISRDVRILSTDVGRTIEPNLKALLRISSCSGSDPQQLIISNPYILMISHAIPRLEFWIKFFSGDIEKLMAAAKKNLGLFHLDIYTSVLRKIAFLKEYGFSQTNIRSILVRSTGFCRSIDTFEVLLKKVEELGLPQGSLVFLRCFVSLSNSGLNRFNAKMEVYKSYGWSEREFLVAFQKNPEIACLSVENIREKMEFLVGRAGCKQSYIASHPLLLMFSLEKRLMPRLHVMNILTSRNLLGRRASIYSLMGLPESMFLEKFVHLNKDKVPELHDIYIAACAGQSRL